MDVGQSVSYNEHRSLSSLNLRALRVLAVLSGRRVPRLLRFARFSQESGSQTNVVTHAASHVSHLFECETGVFLSAHTYDRPPFLQDGAVASLPIQDRTTDAAPETHTAIPRLWGYVYTRHYRK